MPNVSLPYSVPNLRKIEIEVSKAFLIFLPIPEKILLGFGVNYPFAND